MTLNRIVNTFSLILSGVFILAALTALKKPTGSNFKLRTDGYYYTYDTVVNTQTNEKIFRFYPIVFFEDQTLSDFYWQKSKLDFEKLIDKKKYSWVKRFSQYGSYKIIADSIYIQEKTWSNKFFGNNRGKIENANLKGIMINDTTFLLTEIIFLGDTIKQNSRFLFNAYTFRQ